MCAYTAYIYDHNANLLARRCEESLGRLESAVLSLLESFPIGTKVVIYDHSLEEAINSYSRRVLE